MDETQPLMQPSARADRYRIGKRWPGRTFASFLVHLAAEDDGQDMIEYALLVAFIALVGAATWNAITGGIGTAYQAWDSGSQGLWVPPDPGGS